MSSIIEARGLAKRYGRNHQAVAGVDFRIAPGRIVGLIGRNGAGKTTVIKSILGLTPFDGSLSVLGRNPATERNLLMQDVSFIADVAVLPKWLKVRHALDYVAGVHPAFNRARRGVPCDHRREACAQSARALQGHGHAAAPGAGAGHPRKAAGAG
jgi:ABC-2 type transport system ATP-binding protein